MCNEVSFRGRCLESVYQFNQKIQHRTKVYKFTKDCSYTRYGQQSKPFQYYHVINPITIKSFHVSFKQAITNQMMYLAHR